MAGVITAHHEPCFFNVTITQNVGCPYPFLQPLIIGKQRTEQYEYDGSLLALYPETRWNSHHCQKFGTGCIHILQHYDWLLWTICFTKFELMVMNSQLEKEDVTQAGTTKFYGIIIFS